jgi:alpha-tubulin suppressor-like RCC1 family protein
VGGAHSCGIITADVEYRWGWNGAGQLGIGSNTGPESCSENPGNFEPFPCSTRPVRVLGTLTFRRVTAGFVHTCGVTTGNAVYCWGSNLTGQLGVGDGGVGACIPVENYIPCSTRPVRVAGGLAFRLVNAGLAHF